MWYFESQYLTAGQQTTPGPGLRGDGVADPAPPVGGGGEREGKGKGAAPPSGGGGGGGETSSRHVDFVHVDGRIGGENNQPPLGDDAGDEETEGEDSIDLGVSNTVGGSSTDSSDDGSGGAGGSNGGGGEDTGDGDGGEGGVPDSKVELLEPSDDKGQNTGVNTVTSDRADPPRPVGPKRDIGKPPLPVFHMPVKAGEGKAEPWRGGGDAGGAGADAGDGGDLGGAVLADLDPETLMREERRARLNGAVEAAVVRQSDHACNVAFVKTHKTASTTLAGVLYRYGLRHGRRVARFHVEGTAVTLERAAMETEDSGKRVEIFHYHYVWDGYFESTWDQAKKLFKNIMVEPSADAAEGGVGADSGTKFVTVLRDPEEHWLSYFYFYYEPEMKVGVEEYFNLGKHKSRPLNNPLAAEFGIYNERQLDEFILNHLPGFALTMLTENVDEGLVLLGKVMGWDLIDLTYASLLEARDGATRWDDKPVTKAPRPKDLHRTARVELGRATNLDKALYEAAKREYEKVKDRYSEGLEEEVAKFRELQTEVLAVLNEGVGRAGTVSPARAWYMPESDYFFYSTDKTKWYTEEYYPEPLPF
eukprot:g1742.t1